MSTKSKDNAAGRGGDWPALRGGTLPSDIRFLTSLKLELAYFSGRAWLKARQFGGAGAVLRFERVRPARRGGFQPLKSREITPRFLDRTIKALKRWKYDIVSMDEVCRRAVTLASPRRFVCLTFDGAYKDLMSSAYPVLSGHGVPFTVYVPTGFPDGLVEAWWLGLEAVIARENRVRLVIDRQERDFNIANTSGKVSASTSFSRAGCARWRRRISPSPSTISASAIRSTSRRCRARPRWTGAIWRSLRADPLVTIGSATVNYPVLSNLKDAAALREMTMGRAVAQAAFHRDVRHFAYPFGDRASFARKHVQMAEEAGFASAASTIAGIVQAEGRTNLHALPRIAWDGRTRSLRVMRVMLSGTAFRPVKPTRSQVAGDPTP